MAPTPKHTTEYERGKANLSVTNLGGIEDTSIDLEPGVTLLTGRNATNRTSLLRALNGALGGTAATLKSNTDEGEVTLELGDERFTRTYSRTSSGVTIDGTPFTEDDTLVDSFVTLLEDNPARRAVERGDDLHDVIMEPVDTKAIERRIRELQDEKETLESKLDRVTRKQEKQPELEESRQAIQNEIDTVDEKLEEFRDEIVDIDADAEAAKKANELVDKVDDRRQSLRSKEEDIELVESELSALRDDLDEIQAEQEELSEGGSGDRTNLESEIDALREQKRELDNTITSLTTIVEFNTDLLAEESENLPGIEPDEKDVSSALAPEQTQDVVCWTCGSKVEKAAISDRLNDLRSVIEEKQDSRDDISAQIEELEEQLQTITRQEQHRTELNRKSERIQDKIAQREQRLEDLKAKASDLRDEIEDLETEVAETEALRENNLLETYERVSDLEYERGQLENELDDINEKIAEINSLEDPEDLENQIEELADELNRERTRIEDLEEEAVEEFNKHMDDILDVLAFKNLARIWIERKTINSGRGRTETQFDLHVVREDETGTVYEDVVDHLSESEREVVGLVVALAGYLAHKVYDRVPFMLFDSLEAIDSNRIAALVEYFSDFASYLVVALLPEDAQALPSNYRRLTADKLSP